MAVTTAAVIGATAAVAGTANSIKATNDAKKMAQQQIDDQKATQQGLGASTEALSKQNALASAELERQMTPEVPQLRTAANQNLLGGLSDGRYNMSGEQNLLRSQMGQQVGQIQTPLLQAAIAKAQGDLALGGQLSPEAQNLATRQALAKAGTVGGGLGLGRDLVARDLGLSSMQIEQQRLQNASQLGGQELQFGQANSQIDQFNAGNLLNQIQLLNSVNQGAFGRDLATAQFAESIARPIVGLDPGSAANLQIAQQNAQGAANANLANIKGQQNQNYINGIGQIGGALMAFNNQQQTQQPTYVPQNYYQPVQPVTSFYTGGVSPAGAH
jgi:hypothetical protein